VAASGFGHSLQETIEDRIELIGQAGPPAIAEQAGLAGLEIAAGNNQVSKRLN
jgi:hypothetical protein